MAAHYRTRKEGSNSILGRRYGKLVVIGRRRVAGLKYVALCQCDCGSAPLEIVYQHLRDRRRSCGCDKNIAQTALFHGDVLPLEEIASRSGRSVNTIRDYIRLGKSLDVPARTAIGKRYGYLTILRVDTKRSARRYWCRCDCGKEGWHYSSAISTRKINSCGCKKVSAKRNLVGKVFTRLSVIADTDRRTSAGVWYWLCRCECGVEKTISGASLISGVTRSCGCLRREQRSGPVALDLSDHRFGSLTVRAMAQRTPKVTTWICVCDCGANRTVTGHDLRNGKIDSCTKCSGTQRDERTIEYHGESLPASVVAAKLGCTRNWLYQAIRKGKTLDQIGQRQSLEPMVMLHGVRVSVRHLANISGLKIGTVRFRLQSGMTPEAVVACPLRAGRSLVNVSG
jgi:hypothetical protein